MILQITNYKLQISDFIRQLPKAELHVHLEGSVEPPTLVELSRKYDAAPLDAAAVEELYRYADFPGFLNAFKNVTERLRAPQDYELIANRLMARLAEQNVVHAEVIFSAGVCLWRKQDVRAIFAAMERAREQAEHEFGISILWIWDAIRQFGVEHAGQVLDEALRAREQFESVAGFGIGGDEHRRRTDRTRYHRDS